MAEIADHLTDAELEALTGAVDPNELESADPTNADDNTDEEA